MTGWLTATVRKRDAQTDDKQQPDTHFSTVMTALAATESRVRKADLKPA